MTFQTTAIYPNRLEDKQELEEKLTLPEQGDETTEFHLPNGILFARGYRRIVYGDLGPYVEFALDHIHCQLLAKFNNDIDYDNLPYAGQSKYYYFWLYPKAASTIKVYLQIKPVNALPNAPKRADGKKSDYNRAEGYADYQRGYFYVSPYEPFKIVRAPNE
jgi:hypothetical protein